MRITTFASGSSGNCALLTLDGVHILLDAGISYRRICAELERSGVRPEDIAAVLITHEHSDHIAGLGTLVRHCAAPICAPCTVARHLERTVAGAAVRLRIFAPGTPEMLETLRVQCFPTSHDTDESVGWRIEGSAVFALATDTGCVTEAVEAGLRGADAVLIEANHDLDMLRTGPYPVYLKRRILSQRGHLSNADCAALAARLAGSGTRQIILGHLSRENNRPAIAYQTVRAALEGTETALCVAPAAERLTVEVEPCLL
jgi:phosphoribosyl 1,2-cyclic phosphodiesterase